MTFDNFMPDWYAAMRRPLFFLQVIYAVTLFARPLPWRRGWQWRLPAALALGILAAWATAWLYFPGQAGAVYTLGRIALIPLMYGSAVAYMMICYRTDIWVAMFVAAAGYTVQNIGGSVKGIMKLLPGVVAASQTTVGMLLLDLLCYGGVSTLLYFVLRQDIKNSEQSYDNHNKVLFSCAVIFCQGVSRINTDYLAGTATAQFFDGFYAILTAVLLLLLQYNTLERNRLGRDTDTLRELVHQQYTQYQTSRESAELVNEKYHDLKKMIGTLAGRITPQEAEKLQETIAGYDAVVHTGNKVLDVLLTENRLVCQKQGIEITCLAGGVDLDFVDELDLYALFGNALSNAIRAVSALPQGVARTITLSVKQEGGLSYIHIENPCADTVLFSDGLPQTEQDKRYHGFGVRSMLRTAEKYGGTLTTRQTHGVFYLDAVLVG